jgi:hypothetical protein
MSSLALPFKEELLQEVFHEGVPLLRHSGPCLGFHEVL